MMRKFCFLAPACVLLFSFQLLAADRVDSRGAGTKDDDALTVELFDAMKSGDVEVRVVAKDPTKGNVLIRNTTKKRLSIKLPEAFATIPVAAQFGPAGGLPSRGFPGGGFPGGGFPGGGAGFPGGVGLNGGLNNGMQGGANQALGAGFQQGQNALNGGNGRGMGINGFPGLFKVEPEKVGKLKMTSVCLEHGKPNPNSRIKYELLPLDTVVSDAVTREAVAMLARGEVDQQSAQAAAWHLANGLSWKELEKKVAARHINGRVQLLFTRDQIARAKQIVEEAGKRASQQQESRSDSLAQGK